MVRRTSEQQLMAEVESNLREFMYMSEHAFTVVPLWIAHSHLRAYDGSFLPQRTPRLPFLSKEAGCGKTMAMELTTLMSSEGEVINSPTSFGMVTAINHNITIGLDEIDKFFGGRGTTKQDIQIILNSGYKRGSYIMRQRNDEIERLNCHGPVVLAGKNANRFLTSETFETLRSRSIPIVLERKPVGHHVSRYRSELHEGRLRHTAKRLTRWGASEGPSIVRVDVADIFARLGIDNRDEEIWTVLFQVANHIGGVWPSRIEAAAKALVLGDWGDDDVPILSPAEELLVACRAAFDADEDKDFMRSRDLIAFLMDEARGNVWWRKEWRSPKAASMGLSNSLDTFGIEADRTSIGGEQVRGYWRDDVVADNLDDLDNLDNQTTSVPVGEWDWSLIDE